MFHKAQSIVPTWILICPLYLECPSIGEMDYKIFDCLKVVMFSTMNFIMWEMLTVKMICIPDFGDEYKLHNQKLKQTFGGGGWL